MGWSCRDDAGKVLDAWREACAKSTDSSNRWIDNSGKAYFYQVGRENPDGAITGTVYVETGDRFCKLSSSFRIEPDGKVTRAPAFLKAATKSKDQS